MYLNIKYFYILYHINLAISNYIPIQYTFLIVTLPAHQIRLFIPP